MSNQQNNNAQVDDENRGPQQQSYHSRSFYRKRPGNGRQNQDLGEDENPAPNDDDAQRSNHSDENNGENNTRGRGRRGGFRRGRGRERFSRGVPFYGGFPQAYSPYSNYVNGNGGFYGPQGGFYDQPYRGDDASEQEGFYNYPRRGNRGFRGGRGRGQVTKNENNDHNNDQQQGEDNVRRNSNRRQRRQRQPNENAPGTEQQTDGAVTDDQQRDENNQGSARQQQRRPNRRRRNTNPSQNDAETEGRVQSGQTQKPKDDETIVKNVVRNIVTKVARRLAPRNRRKSQTNAKETAADNNNDNTDVDQSQARNVRRGGRGRRGGRPGNGYFIDQGYYDPYGMTPYYYGMYYGYVGRGRGRGGRGRGRFRQRGGANKENQPQNNSEEGKPGESNSAGDNAQSKPLITEQVNQSSTNGDSRQ